MRTCLRCSQAFDEKAHPDPNVHLCYACQSRMDPDKRIKELESKLFRAKEILGSMHADLRPQHREFFDELQRFFIRTRQ